MARNVFHQLALCGDRPFFDVRSQPVGVCENEIRSVRIAKFFGPLRGGSKTGNHYCDRRWRIAGVFFPALLGGDGPLQNETRSGAHNHHAWVEQAEPIVFMQAPR